MKRCHSFIFKFLNFYIVSAAVLLTLSGCIEEYEADITSEDSDILVVEGTICSSQLNQFILSRSQPVNYSDTPLMVTGARVSVRGSDGSEWMTQETDGYYSCRIDALDPNVNYYLHIETDGEVYESEPQKPIRTEEIENVSVVQETPKSNIDILVTPEVPFDPDKANYYSWTYDETWEVHPEYRSIMYYDTQKMEPVIDTHLYPERGWKDARGSTIMVGASQNYEGRHIQRLKLYDIDRSDSRIYFRYSGLVHQRAISKEEYEYVLARRQAGFEMGGLFTPLPSALPTNIHCLTSKRHVIGFVGCALNTSEYRFFLNTEDYSVLRPVEKDTRLWYEDPTAMQCIQLVKERDLFLCDWYTTMSTVGTPIVHSAWAYEYQLDVRLTGAYIEIPDFW